MNALLYTLFVFVLILFLARLKVPLAFAIVIGSIILAAMFDMSAGDITRSISLATIQPRTISLIFVMTLILALSAIMRQTGQFEQIVSLAKLLFRHPAVTMAVLPALIGLLPMPGGALFSAPMVQSAASPGKVKGSVLSAINYWFRHIWEHFWPLYPGVMLAMTLTGFSYGLFAIFQIPLGIFMAATGLMLFWNTHPDLHIKSAAAPAGTKRKFFGAISSIWIILLVWIPSKFLVALLLSPLLIQTLKSPAEKYLPLALGLIASIIWTARRNNVSRVSLIENFAQKFILSMIALVVSVMVFQYILQQTGAAQQIADELLQLHVPVVLVVMALPFIAGMVTGLAIGFVGTSFPIVLAMVNGLPEPGLLYPYVTLAYGFGHLGQMMSPLHLCHVVSNEYFKTGFSNVYPRLIPIALADAVLIITYFYILKITV
ncbi:MAG: DUF401 family protein [Sedimentisphaerales bacterium]|nr:DUF401 family protein [Sedimentisphaerales bacterium]